MTSNISDRLAKLALPKKSEFVGDAAMMNILNDSQNDSWLSEKTKVRASNLWPPAMSFDKKSTNRGNATISPIVNGIKINERYKNLMEKTNWSDYAPSDDDRFSEISQPRERKFQIPDATKSRGTGTLSDRFRSTVQKQDAHSSIDYLHKHGNHLSSDDESVCDDDLKSTGKARRQVPQVTGAFRNSQKLSTVDPIEYTQTDLRMKTHIRKPKLQSDHENRPVNKVKNWLIANNSKPLDKLGGDNEYDEIANNIDELVDEIISNKSSKKSNLHDKYRHKFIRKNLKDELGRSLGGDDLLPYYESMKYQREHDLDKFETGQQHFKDEPLEKPRKLPPDVHRPPPVPLTKENLSKNDEMLAKQVKSEVEYWKNFKHEPIKEYTENLKTFMDCLDKDTNACKEKSAQFERKMKEERANFQNVMNSEFSKAQIELNRFVKYKQDRTVQQFPKKSDSPDEANSEDFDTIANTEIAKSLQKLRALDKEFGPATFRGKSTKDKRAKEMKK